MISLIISVILMLIIWFFERNHYINRNSAIIVVGITIFIVLSNNYYNGYDWINYLDNFNCFKQNGLYCWQKYDPGYTSIVYLCAKFFDDYHSVVVIVALINSFSLCYFAKNNSDNPILFILLYFSLYAWVLYSETLRQSLAISFTMLSLGSFRKNKKISCATWFCIACLFHISALFMAVLYFLKLRVKISYITFLLVMILALCILPKIAVQFYSLNPRIFEYFLDSSWGEGQHLGLLQLCVTAFSLLLLFITWERLYYTVNVLKDESWGKANLIAFSLLSVLFAFGKLYAQYFEVVSRLNYYVAIPAFLYLSSKIKNLYFSNKIIIYPLIIVYILYSPIRIFATLQKFDDYNSFYLDVLIGNENVNINSLKNKRCEYLEGKFSSCID